MLISLQENQTFQVPRAPWTAVVGFKGSLKARMGSLESFRRCLVQPRGVLQGPFGVTTWSLDIPIRAYTPTYNHIYDYIWSHMIILWSYMIIYNCIQSDMITYMLSYDHIQSYMIMYDHIFSYMITDMFMYDHIWSYMIMYGHIHSYMTTYMIIYDHMW